MSKYEPLANFLADQKGDRWDASFDQVEERLGFALPPSAYRHPAWWANQNGQGHSQAHGWRNVGWRTAGVDLENRRVRFERDVETVDGTTASDLVAQLFRRAAEVTGIGDRDDLVAEALKALVAREAASRLALLGGTMADYRAPGRERPHR